MERLTSKREADAQRVEYERRLANGYPKNVPEERFLRLAAYEDTGLMPEEIVELMDGLITLKALNFFDEISDYLEAKKDGRVVILPCKVGDTVYEVQHTRKRVQPLEITSVIIDRNGEPFLRWESKDSFGIYLNTIGFSKLGETVFLSREAAEAALQEQEVT